MAAIPRPKGRVQRVLQNPAIYDIPSSLLGGTSSFVAAYRFFQDGKEAWMWVFIAIGAVLTAGGVAKAITSYSKHAKAEDLHELQGCLLMLYHTICGSSDCKAARLRITAHVASVDGKHLQQVLDYVGDGRGGRTAGRTFPVQSGVTGHAFRAREPIVAKCSAETHQDYVEDLVHNWGYTPEDARQRQADTRSWFALPIQERPDGDVLGILYLDSTSPDFFDDNAIVALVTHAAVGIAFYVGKRYSAS